MAFVRAWAEGVDLLQAAQRYLGHGREVDARRARTELQGLLDQLRSVARAQARPELAALLRRDPEAMAEPAGQQPSLDEFRALQPEDFYSEAELLALYEAEHGAPDARSGARRRQRLRARQLAALQWLESVAVREPQPADALAGWLDERLAARLAAVGLTRLADLLAWIRRRGFHWHRPIPRVGAAAAGRVVHWLQQHAPTLGTLPPWALQPASQLDRAALTRRGNQGAAQLPSGLSGPPVPLERLARLHLPAALSGREGRYRARPGSPAGGMADAEDDLSALHTWLRLRAPGSATWRAYRKEAERLLLWAWWVAGKPVSSLDAADLPAYQAFLAAPAPGWTAPRGTPRWHEDWRPFEGPLSARSAAMALGIVRGMLDAWVAQGHLAVNCWTVSSRTVDAGSTPSAPSSPPSWRQATAPAGLRALNSAQQAAFERWMARRLRAQGATPALLRLQALWFVASDTGLRPAELVAARLGWLRPDRAGPAASPALTLSGGEGDSGDAGVWWLDVPADAGIGIGTARTLELGPQARQALRQYLACRGLDGGQVAEGATSPASTHAAASATTRDQTPLFAHLRSQAGLSPARLYEVLAQAFKACADDLDGLDQQHAGSAAEAAAIRQASTHWLRHGFGVRVAEAGAPVGELQQRMGHRSRASAAVYRRATKAVRPPRSGI